MKKLLLGLGAVSIAALPVLAVVSCGSTPTKVVELKITAKENVNQEDITNAVTAYNKSSNENDKLLTIKNVFDGVTADNMKNFSVKAIKENGATKNSFELKAHKGYTFVGSLSLITSQPNNNIKVLHVTKKSDVTKDKLVGVINNYIIGKKTYDEYIGNPQIDQANIEKAKVLWLNAQITGAKKILVGVNEDALSNTTIEVIAPTNDIPGSFKITTKKDYTFGNGVTEINLLVSDYSK